jgi:hypothetical protein
MGRTPPIVQVRRHPHRVGIMSLAFSDERNQVQCFAHQVSRHLPLALPWLFVLALSVSAYDRPLLCTWPPLAAQLATQNSSVSPINPAPTPPGPYF